MLQLRSSVDVLYVVAAPLDVRCFRSRGGVGFEFGLSGKNRVFIPVVL